MITVNPADRKPILNPEYYVMKHFSHFVLPGARRIGLRGSWTGDAVAFQNTDGQRVVVIANPFKESRVLNLPLGEITHRLELEPESFNTIVIPS